MNKMTSSSAYDSISRIQDVLSFLVESLTPVNGRSPDLSNVGTSGLVRIIDDICVEVGEIATFLKEKSENDGGIK